MLSYDTEDRGCDTRFLGSDAGNSDCYTKIHRAQACDQSTLLRPPGSPLPADFEANSSHLTLSPFALSLAG